MDYKDLEKLMEQFAQGVSYKFGDLILSYPVFARPLVMAVVQSCITANLAAVSEEERELFEKVKNRMVVTTLPAVLDPRKHGPEV